MKYLTLAFATLVSANAFAADPVSFALEQISGWYGQAGSRNIVAKADVAESPNQTTVTITDRNLLDDSVFATRTIFLVDFYQGRWNVIEKTELFQCQPGRGQQNFAPKNCF